ncbi:MAG TPA: TrkH family potassium uptake protein [Rhodospirillaceae bacterium]|nr:TrkH family potassium uptake protein [Rhodospirillaceae bacterium]
MFDLRPVLFIDGILLLILALAMGVPVAVDLVDHASEWPAFLAALSFSAFIGLALVFGNLVRGWPVLTTRQAFFLTVSSWLLVALFASLPFHFSSVHLSITDGVFETISGITTTGATVLMGLDTAPHALLIWRAMLQWLGGAGIIVTALSLLPVLRIGGMQIFRLENSDKLNNTHQRLSKLVGRSLLIYGLFSLIIALALLWAGMTPLEAACHAMATLSTGGFSTSDQSLGHFGEAARWICVLGMLAGSLTFSGYSPSSRRGRWPVLADSQVRWFFWCVIGFSLLLTFWNWAAGDMDPDDAFRHSVFNVVSILTTTGFHSVDYDAWGGFAQITFFIISFIGGCTGSTAGSIKVFRYEVLFAVTGVHIRRLLQPHGVFPIHFNRLQVSDAVIRSVLGFVMLYFICLASLGLALTFCGLDAISSLSGAASALGNVGPGLGRVLGPSGSYQGVSDCAKWLLAAGMLLGRLELAPPLILFSRAFWRG